MQENSTFKRNSLSRELWGASVGWLSLIFILSLNSKVPNVLHRRKKGLHVPVCIIFFNNHTLLIGL